MKQLFVISAIEPSFHFPFIADVGHWIILRRWSLRQVRIQMSLMNVSQAWSHCYVWVGARLTNLSFLHCRIICSAGNTDILFPPSVSCLWIVSRSVRQDMIKLLRAIFFTISMRSSSQQKPGPVPRKQWNRRRASGQGGRDMIGVLISES